VGEAENLSAMCVPIIYEIWEPRRLITLWTSTTRYRDSFYVLPSRMVDGEKECDLLTNARCNEGSGKDYVGYELLTAVVMKISVLAVAHCSPLKVN
jgi:hypothetical protein